MQQVLSIFRSAMELQRLLTAANKGVLQKHVGQVKRFGLEKNF